MLTEVSFKLNKDPVKKMVVFLHGYGADGQNLIDISYAWAEHLPPTLFLAPNAPLRCAEIQSGYEWFNLNRDNNEFTIQNVRDGLGKIMPTIVDYLKQKTQEFNIEMSDLAVVGFSQGAMIAMNLPWYFEDLAGIISYSGALFVPKLTAIGKNIPMLLVHGEKDVVIAHDALEYAKGVFKSEDFKDVIAISCPGTAHSIDMTGMNLGLRFLKRVLQ